jgi:hypothetical protein
MTTQDFIFFLSGLVVGKALDELKVVAGENVSQLKKTPPHERPTPEQLKAGIPVERPPERQRALRFWRYLPLACYVILSGVLLYFALSHKS